MSGTWLVCDTHQPKSALRSWIPEFSLRCKLQSSTMFVRVHCGSLGRQSVCLTIRKNSPTTTLPFQWRNKGGVHVLALRGAPKPILVCSGPFPSKATVSTPASVFLLWKSGKYRNRRTIFIVGPWQYSVLDCQLVPAHSL